MQVSNNLRNNRQNFQQQNFQQNQRQNQRKQDQMPQMQGIDERAVEYKCGEETVKLSPGIIRNYLVKGNGVVTDQEVVMFLNLCRFQHLNPFLREAYLIKFGNEPASMVVGKDAMTKRARRNPDFAGYQAGVIVQDVNTKVVDYRTGGFYLPTETIVGGWAKVFVKGYTEPVESAVAFGEYVGTKRDGTINGQWAKKPATMIRKVALVQALREAFPEDLAGLYDQSEMGIEITEEPPIDINTIDSKPKPPKKDPEPPKNVPEPPKNVQEPRNVEQGEEIEFPDVDFNEPPDYLDNIEDLQGVF